MFKKILESITGVVKTRIFVIAALFTIMLIVLLHRIFVLQIVKGEDYLESFTYRIQKETQLDSARGTIYDTNGIPLAYNKLSYAITVDDSTQLSDNTTKNTMISKLITLVEANDNSVVYNIPIALNDNGEIEFTGNDNTILRFKKDIYSTETLSEKQTNATALEVYEYMRSKSLFNLDDTYKTDEALKIMSVRYEIYMKRYERYLSVTVASDANASLVAAVKENADQLPGVSVTEGYVREYADSKYFSNITGYLGAISEDELSSLTASGNSDYSSGDLIGKTGIESYMESYLKGTKGSQTMYVNSLGSVLEVADKEEPVSGEDVYLSIDANLQKAAYDMLESRIAGILLSKMSDSGSMDSGTSSVIPIKSFYYALLDNGVISISHLASDSATDTEKSFYGKYTAYEASIIDTLVRDMSLSGDTVTDEFADYIYQAYKLLSDNGLLDTSSFTTANETYMAWRKKEISFEDFMKYAITNNTVDVSSLNLDSAYLDTDEIYQAVADYISVNLPENSNFVKDVYYYMLENDYISGRDICLLLYEQGILEQDSDYTALQSGSMSAYLFMYNKIYNMEITPDQLALAPCSGSYIMVDINTGKVKAMVSYPSYDANRINEMAYFSQLLNNASNPFYNRVTQQTIAPGSTFKMISAITGLEEGVITTDTTVYDNVAFDKVSPTAYCWNRGGHGTVNVVSAIEYSCNYFFYNLGFNLGYDEDNKYSESTGVAKLAKYAAMFGLNEMTGVELTESQPTVSDTDAVRSAIGQGTHSYTAAQLARYVSAIANRGSLYDLSVLSERTDSDGNVTEEYSPVLESTIDLKESTWDAVQRGMYLVCNESSYKVKMSGKGVTIAGKSGTAQESETLPDHSLFVGYAPYDKPEVAAAIIIPNGYGSSSVLDLYTDIMRYYFHITNDEGDATEGRTASLLEGSIAAD